MSLGAGVQTNNFLRLEYKATLKEKLINLALKGLIETKF